MPRMASAFPTDVGLSGPSESIDMSLGRNHVPRARDRTSMRRAGVLSSQPAAATAGDRDARVELERLRAANKRIRAENAALRAENDRLLEERDYLRAAIDDCTAEAFTTFPRYAKREVT